MTTALYISFFAAYLILFYAIISRLNTGLDRARSINVRGIMTVAAVLLLGWPPLLTRLSATHVFADWHYDIPILAWAMFAPILLGLAILIPSFFRNAGGQLSKREYVWPLVAHFAIAVALWHLGRLENEADQKSLWPIIAGTHTFLGITAICLFAIKNISKNVLFFLFHIIGFVIGIWEIFLIISTIPRHISSNSGLMPIDQELAYLPLIFTPAILIPLVFTLHVWGLGHIIRSNNSKNE
ncbi:MAG: hypothetical protein AB8F95_02475 [Bacteroidia bacterium]